MNSKPSRYGRLRRLVQTVCLVAFPVSLNYFSPYVIMDGALRGVVAGSALVFAFLFLSAPFLGRVWCSWGCPAGVIQDQLSGVNGKRVVSKWADRSKYLIWGVWMGTIVWFFAMAGFRAFNPLHLTSSGISVDAPSRYVIYFGVIVIFTVVALAVGRRGACHSLCWMAPFMVFGRKAGDALRLPGLRLAADSSKCTSCRSCEAACPMSLSIGAMAKAGRPEHPECIQCAECVAVCRSDALRLKFGRMPR
jgi:polyferredoxin